MLPLGAPDPGIPQVTILAIIGLINTDPPVPLRLGEGAYAWNTLWSNSLGFSVKRVNVATTILNWTWFICFACRYYCPLHKDNEEGFIHLSEFYLRTNEKHFTTR